VFRILFTLGLLLFVPGLAALGYSIWNGPLAWATDEQTFWGTPISLFVFWIGLAHAGTLLSAVFLALGVKLDRRTALLAEMSTLVCLAIAAVFPLMHLGVLQNFYMVIPFADARGNFANLRSPLVWDLCCIAVYGVLSLVFFVMHLLGNDERLDESSLNESALSVAATENSLPAKQSLKKMRKPMAWILFPLVLWVHTVVSLDFANAFVPEWRGAFFPLYFIAGAIFSGLALVNLLLVVENYRVRLLEKMMVAGTFFMMVFWAWNFVLKEDWCVSAFVFAALLPQLMWVQTIRESRILRGLICLSVLLGMLLERIFMVAPSVVNEQGKLNLGLVDIGLFAFGAGTFLLVFFSLRKKLSRLLENDEIQMGEVEENSSADNPEEEAEEKQYFSPLSTPEYKVLRLPLLFGILAATIFCVWAVDKSDLLNVDLAFANIFPVIGPIVALVSGIILCARPMCARFKPVLKSHKFLYAVLALIIVALGCAAGLFYGGGSSIASGQETSEEVLQTESRSNQGVILLWNARCASCHGADGNFNEKFVREFYPVPQKLDFARVDSIGEDSLVQVILKGRANMSAYGNRIGNEDARGLVRYMRHLAELNELDRALDSIATNDQTKEAAK